MTKMPLEIMAFRKETIMMYKDKNISYHDKHGCFKIMKDISHVNLVGGSWFENERFETIEEAKKHIDDKEMTIQRTVVKAATSQQLIDKVLDQIVRDVKAGDVTAIEELLTFVPEKYLKGYL
jgi:hypothetical protein